jgi:23S rRNA pseudouridine1911/1915/1917 synthase
MPKVFPIVSTGRPWCQAKVLVKEEATNLVVPQELVGSALDAVVRALYTTTWGEARKWIARGKITVNGAVWTDGRRKVGAGATIARTLHAPRPRAAALPAGAIVHVDAHVVVVDKPSGMSTVPYDENETGTLDERVRDHLARAKGGRPPLGVVHRIDKETSGLVVFTRTWLAKKSLASQFRAHTVHRRYLAIAHGDVHARTFRSHLVADRGDGLRGSSRSRHQEGQLAVTHVDVVERLQGATLIACRLETGRTHQIRIHLSEAGHPLVGERVYVRGFEGEPIPAPRLMLHAAELGFVHPATERDVRYEVDPPADFAETLARLRA